jgi:hypothetical protein
MNANAINRSSNAKTANNGRSACKKFCKVCFDAGKPENVYTNHAVKTMNTRTGKLETTCVTLLALECRYCFTAGHTVKFCPAIKENNKNRKEHEIHNARERHFATVAQQEAAAKEKTVVKKGFALLQEDSDDEEVATPVVMQTVAPPTSALNDFPSLVTKTGGASNLPTVMSFAATAALPPKPKVTFAVAPIAAVASTVANEDYDSDYEEEIYESELPTVTEYRCPEVDSCFSYRERHGYEEDDSW